MEVALYEPEIPPNTGNIARTCAAFNVPLNLIEPLGFLLEDRFLKRAGLDYWPHVQLAVWPDWASFYQVKQASRLIMATTRGVSSLADFAFRPSDLLLFGAETRGLPPHILERSPFHVRIPFRKMEAGGVRSLNLSTSAGIFLFQALCQCNLLPS